MSFTEVVGYVLDAQGNALPVGPANPSAVRFGDSPSIDAFARLRVSNPVTLFDSQSQYRDETILFETVTSGAGSSAHVADEAAVDLSVSAASGDFVLRQSREYFRYQPGKSQLVLVTFNLAAGQAGMEQWVGYGDDLNGVFFKEENGTLSMVLRSSAGGSTVDTEVPQASWNQDPLDGTGPSGITLDPTNAQIFLLDAEWLGVGRVRVGFVIDGIPVYVHTFNHANNQTGVYNTTMNLPVRWYIVNTGATAGAATLRSICASVISEGGFEGTRGFPFTASTADTGVGSVGDTEVPLLAIRPALTFNSVENRTRPRITRLEFFAQAAPCKFRLYYQPTVTGGAWAQVDANSSVEANTTMTGFSGGTPILTGFAAADRSGGSSAAGSRDVVNELPFTINVAGDAADTLLVTAVRAGTTGTATASTSIQWLEYR